MAGTNINIQPIVNNSSVALAEQQKLSEMSYEIKSFEHPKFGEMRIAEFKDGTVLFCLSDAARALDYANPAKAVIDHCKKGVSILETPTYNQYGAEVIQKMKFGKEGNLYRLAASSKLPEAESFQDWVFDDVLPTIRKTGSYSLVQQPIQQPLVQPLNPLTLTDMTSWVKDLKDILRLNDASTLELLQDVSNQYGGILPVPKYTKSEGEAKPASTLFEKRGYGKKSRTLTSKLNEVLLNYGILTKIPRKKSDGSTDYFWSITDEGSPYGENDIPRGFKKKTQPLWYVDKFDEMLSLVNFNPEDYIKR